MSSGRPGASSQGEDGDSQFDDGSVGSGEYDDARLSVALHRATARNVRALVAMF